MDHGMIKTINKLQDLFSSLGYEPIELPKIVVVGTQSAGKSSVLEAIVGRTFLPRGSGIVTRCPLVLQLHHCPEGDKRRRERDTADMDEWSVWGEFLHTGDRRFKVEELCEEIQKKTDELAGSNKGICHEAIHLRVFAPEVPTLTLVDLPGITKVPVGDQPKDIEEQILELINEHIENELSIILAVVPANTDMAATDSLKIAKQADPNGDRTLAVVTKLDLMDKGTDAREILTGSIIPVKRGIVGVVNRSQQDINESKSMKDALQYEAAFLQERYADLAFQHGTPYLAKKLSSMLLEHIKENLPRVQAKISERTQSCREQLSVCGTAVVDQRRTLMEIISAFANAFSDRLEGGSRNIQQDKQLLCGGAKICYVLHSFLERQFAKTNPCAAYTDKQVMAVIRNSSGTKPPLLFAESAFEVLIKTQLEKLLAPSKQALDQVGQILLDTGKESLPGILRRFPSVKAEILKVLRNMVTELSGEARDTVEKLVEAEMGFITYHRLADLKKELSETLASDEVPHRLPFARDSGRSAGISSTSSRLGDSTSERTLVIPTAELLTMSDSDKKQIFFLGKMLDSYYKMVAQSLQDSVAKAIMTFLVNKVNTQLQVRLGMMSLASSQETMARIFAESEDVTALRAKTERELVVLEDALVILSEFEFY